MIEFLFFANLITLLYAKLAFGLNLINVLAIELLTFLMINHVVYIDELRTVTLLEPFVMDASL